MMPDETLYVAAKAVITDPAGRLLLVRESPIETNSQSGKYGIVGGRLEPGESFFEALHREVEEEVGLTVKPIKPIHLDEWRPVVKGQQFHVVATFFWCSTEKTDITLSAEHDGFIWIDPTDYRKYPIMSPDNQAIDRLIEEMKQ